MKELHPHEYPTTDLPLASFLRCRGHRLIRVDSDGRRGTFIFPDTDELKEDVLIWMNDEQVTLPAQSFPSTLRRMKALVFGESVMPRGVRV